ncbi:MAG: TonB-dependent receptor plug domain-containing protein, partial [Steroidobacteraceae bacterium]
MTTRHSSTRNVLLAAAVAAALPVPALAQDEPAALGEIIVTSRKREENLQDVPLSVTALSGEVLEDMGVPDMVAIGQSVPNVTLEASRATNSTLTAFIRGVGQQDPVAGFEGGVGIYLDDVYLARPQGTVFDIYDVERVEVLRGPQGTLYGSGSLGGTLRYIMREPDPSGFSGSFNGSVSQTADSDGENYTADLVLNVPLSQAAAVRVSAGTLQYDGVVDYVNVYEVDQNGVPVAPNGVLDPAASVRRVE